jgi:hypothetical protein
MKSSHATALCGEPERAGSRVRRKANIPTPRERRAAPAQLPRRCLSDENVILEIKAVAPLLPGHDTRSQTYPRWSGLPTVLSLNFHMLRLNDGLRHSAG